MVYPQDVAGNNYEYFLILPGNADIFLTADDVLAEELEANKDVIVEEIPPSFGGGD